MERLQRIAAALQVNRFDTTDMMFYAMAGSFLGADRPWWHVVLLFMAYLVFEVLVGITASYRRKPGRL